MTGFGFGDAEASRHIGEEPHRGEFTGADGKAADREGEFDQRRLAPVLLRLGRNRSARPIVASVMRIFDLS